MRLRIQAVLAVALLVTACGGGGGGGGSNPPPPPPPPPSAQVTITPAQASLAVETGQLFTCAVANSSNSQCTLQVQEAGGGTISVNNVYVPPTTPGTYHVIATSTADPTSTATATITVTPAPPPAARPWVTGYYTGWYWDQMYPPQSVDMTAMTHFVFGRVAPGGGSLNGTAGQLVPGGGNSHDPGLSPDGVRSVEDYLIRRAQAAGVRTLLMLGGDGLDGRGFLLSTTDAVRPTFVRNIVDYLVAHDYDGVDVDWENELEGNPDMGVTAAEARRRLIALITEIRAEANRRPRYQGANRPVLVTFPGYAVSINFLEPGGKVEQWQADVAHIVDQYNLMSYGIGTAFPAQGWRSWLSSPIFGATSSTPYDLDTSIAAYMATGVPRRRIGVGIGFYGIYYSPPVFGPKQELGDSDFEANDVALRYNVLVEKGYLSHGTYHWDTEALVGYRSYFDPANPTYGYVPAIDPASTPAGFLSYESEQSILAKGQWVRQTGVGGAIIWTLNYGWLHDSQTNPLLAAVKQGFLPAP